MAVYFIQAGADGAVKIGMADFVPARLWQLQCANYQELRVIRTANGGKATERWFHRHFEDLRIRGEWFTFTATMLTTEPPLLIEPPRRPRTKIDDIIQAAGGPDVIAPKIEKTPDAVKKWRVNGIPYPYWPLLIAEAQMTAAEILAANMAVKAEHSESPPDAAA